MIFSSNRYPGQLMPVGARYWHNAGQPINAMKYFRSPTSGLGSPDGLGGPLAVSGTGELTETHPERDPNMNKISRNLNGPYRKGVPNPYTAHVHPYPTRFHGGVYTRPEFGMPYVRRPHAVFKPDDFYTYYGVQGLGGLGGGSFGGSSLGNGTIGGNSFGLGATGRPIMWHDFNTKTKALQGALNKVLTANQFREIGTDGKLGALTCAGLGICRQNFMSELQAQVEDEIIQEATAICNKVVRDYPSIKADIARQMETLVANRNPLPDEPYQSPAEVVPADTAPVVLPAPPPADPPATTPATPPLTPPVIAQPSPPVIEIPEVDVTASPPKQDVGSNKLAWGVGLALAAGVGWYVWKKKKGK